MEGAPLPLAEAAYRAIRQDIVMCVLEPGGLVTRSQLVARYALGHAPVREALNRLAQEQLVQVLPREGYLIAPITLKQVHDLLDARLLVEPPIARLAAGRIDPVALRDLGQRGEGRHRMESQDELRAFVTANTAFHLLIARATGNDRLVAIVGGLLDGMERFMYASYLLRERDESANHEHDEFIAALIAGDADRAEELMRRGILFAREFVLAALHASKALQSVNLFPPGAS